MTRKLLIVAIVIAIAGCKDQLVKHDATMKEINAEMDKAIEERAKEAMLPPLVVEMPKGIEVQPLEQRFDLNVSGAPAAQVFLAIASGTRYSIVVHPDVRESISVNLKDVTVPEALDVLRERFAESDFFFEGVEVEALAHVAVADGVDVFFGVARLALLVIVLSREGGRQSDHESEKDECNGSKTQYHAGNPPPQRRTRGSGKLYLWSPSSLCLISITVQGARV